MSEALVFEAQLDRDSIPAKHPATELQCHLKLWSSTEVGHETPLTINTYICLVFDCSSSMWGEKLDTAIDSAKLIVDMIHESHTISLVAFQSETKLLVDNAQATEADKESIKAKIDGITDLVGGFTDTAAGIRVGMQAMADSQTAAKIMLILTDGNANSPSAAEKAALDATKAGIQLFAVGIGSDYNAEHILKLVKASSGTVFGEQDLEKVKGTFAQLSCRIGNLMAANARIAMTFNNQVKPKRAYKTSPEQAFLGELTHTETQLIVGNIERGKIYGFLVAIEAPPHSAGDLEIARATLTYDLPAANLFGHSQEVIINITYIEGVKPGAERRSDLWETAQRARRTELAERFVDAYNRSDQQKAIRYMEGLVQDSEQLGDHALQVQYTRLLDDLRQNRSIGRDKLNSLVVSSLQPAPPKPEPPKPAQQQPTPKEVTPTAPVVHLFDVVLNDPGENIILLIRVLRDATGLSLHEVSEMVKNSGNLVGESMHLDKANHLKDKLEEHGAQIEVRSRKQEQGLDDESADI